MRSSVSKFVAWINSSVDWFIPPQLRGADDLLQAVRMFLFSHLFGPFLGHTISLSMLYIQGGADASWWVFFAAVTAFWPFPFVLRLTGRYVPLALLSVENLMFCIFWGCYHYGGISSPILPWLVTVPLLAFFYLPGRGTRILVGLMIVANLAVFYTIYSVVGFPNEVPMEHLVFLGLVSTFCASVYVSMMALFYANTVSSQGELEEEVVRHRETEQQLREATQQIKQAMLAKAEFLAKMSHELKNPLNSIIGYSEILIDGLDEPDSQKFKDLTTIRSAGSRLLELINDLLDLSRLEAGKMELSPDSVELNSLLSDSAAKWHQAAAAEGNALIVNLARDAEIICDSYKLKQVITNLLSNAVKFTKDGRITLSAYLNAGTLTVTVTDTGIGIPESQVGLLFETFGNSEQETASNYGDDVRLGLPLAQRYCRLMGGELSVRSKLGAGSRFTVNVPVRLVADERPAMPGFGEPASQVA